ncbi:SDR family oxidoreductase [Robertmurraya sp. DFI.2.37]|uniref:SDR family NAD(P)-dependent oxidoreductase n=1 Tax=Robertmurraya sp. DFI.2.37 TaxID=3031819 RepID=UPI0012449F7F|nr:SDR family oxidoreductase [Robertmurraya sp. DFI.2.37]MDF1507526.1 SDR family oxidoreductase [Robertmurraya sp. DFI.2.37]
MTLNNKNIVITGASSGIGEKVARMVAERGARPILLARSTEKLAEVCEQVNERTTVGAIYYQLDVSDVEEVKIVFQKILQEVGHIDILLNNAGFGVFESVHEADFADIEKMFRVNVFGLIACTMEVLPAMLEEKRGHIINVASQAGKLATPKSSGYAATKHAVLGFTNSLRMELLKTNIFVSAVNPGPIETNFFSIADKSGNYVKNVKRMMLKSDYVAEQIIKLMINPKRELNLPRWMNMGSILYNLFPNLAEKLTGSIFDKK